MPCHFCVQSLVLGAENKAFPGQRILSYPGERDLGPFLTSIFQMGTKAAGLLVLGLPEALRLSSLTLFVSKQI